LRAKRSNLGEGRINFDRNLPLISWLAASAFIVNVIADINAGLQFNWSLFRAVSKGWPEIRQFMAWHLGVATQSIERLVHRAGAFHR
jgi:hypothetical protein